MTKEIFVFSSVHASPESVIQLQYQIKLTITKHDILIHSNSAFYVIPIPIEHAPANILSHCTLNKL